MSDASHPSRANRLASLAGSITPACGFVNGSRWSPSHRDVRETLRGSARAGRRSSTVTPTVGAAEVGQAVEPGGMAHLGHREGGGGEQRAGEPEPTLLQVVLERRAG